MADVTKNWNIIKRLYNNHMTQVEALISDSDGTLLDTVSLIRHGQYETAKQYLVEHGIPDEEIPTYEAYDELLTKTVGGSARDTLERTVRLLYEASPHHLDGMDFEKLHDMLNPVQDRIAKEHIKAYEGLSEFLHGLGEAGIALAIFTSGTPHHIVRNFGVALPELDMEDAHLDTSKSDTDKLRDFEKRFADVFGIPKFTVVTADDTEKHKPEPDSLHLAMNRLGVDSSKAIVLGDHKVDMQTAINAGVEERIGVTHGFDDERTLQAHGATHIANSLSDVAKHLRS